MNLKIHLETSEGPVVHVHELRFHIVLALNREIMVRNSNNNNSNNNNKKEDTDLGL